VVHQEELKAALQADPPHTVGQARQRIIELTKIERSLTQVRHFLRNTLGWGLRKLSPLPGGKLSIEELVEQQAEFLQQQLIPLLQRALAGKCEAFFVDAVHPVQGFHTAKVWCERKLYQRTSSGRNRINVLGALNAATRQLYSLYNDSYVNAQTMVELMEWLRKDHRYRRIFLILDNARYLKCKFVTRMAAKYRINLVYLPPYSPNLNIIERLWKYLKKQVLAGKYYATKKDFEQAIVNFLEQINQGNHDLELARLLTLNFQTLNTKNNFSQK
jgi:transposase